MIKHYEELAAQEAATICDATLKRLISDWRDHGKSLKEQAENNRKEGFGTLANILYGAGAEAEKCAHQLEVLLMAKQNSD
jgi:hypothetical protein